VLPSFTTALEGAVGGVALLELGSGGLGEAECGGASSALAGGIDHGGVEGEDFHLPLAVGQGLIDEELRALGCAIEPRLGLAPHEPVEGHVGAPRQDEDECRSAEARTEEESALERRGRTDDRIVRVGDRRHGECPEPEERREWSRRARETRA